jgi:hypothetical protein
MEDELTPEIEQYMRGHFKDSSWSKGLPSKTILPKYALLVKHLLVSEKLLPNDARGIEESIRQAVKGKKILELGCRRGEFLKFLEDHGAIIAGTTHPTSYYTPARKLLGDKALLVHDKAEGAGFSGFLRHFEADYIFSLNYFDKRRWVEPNLPIAAYFHSVKQLAQPHTVLFIDPAMDSKSIVTKREMNRHAIEIGHLDHIRGNGKSYRTYRMTLKEPETFPPGARMVSDKGWKIIPRREE